MESNGNSRGGLLSAGGVLSIIAGIGQIISGLLLAVIILFPDRSMYLSWLGLRVFFLPVLRDVLLLFFAYDLFERPVLVSFMVCAGVLGIVAIVGGISAIRRNRFGLSLAGAICVLPSGIMGILALIFVVLGKREFRKESLNSI